MPIDWKPVNDVLGAQDILSRRYPAPNIPQFPSFQGLTPEQEEGIFSSLRRYIQSDVNKGMQRVQANAASRGVFRSGQLPAMEAEVIKSGNQSYADALSRYFTSKAGMMQQWNLAGANYDMNKWNTLYGGYQSMMSGMGSLVGSFYTP